MNNNINNILRIVLLCLVSLSVQGNDLIFKQGFENSNVISVQISGVVSLGLELKLTAGGTSTLNINENGGYTFELNVSSGQSWQVDVVKLPNNPNQQNCQISQNSGVMGNQGVDDVLIVCNDSPWNWNQMNWQEGGWN